MPFLIGGGLLILIIRKGILLRSTEVNHRQLIIEKLDPHGRLELYVAVGARGGGAAGHHLQVLSVDALEGGGGGMRVGILLFFLLEAGGFLSPQVLNKVLNGVVLLLAAAETIEI